jgi:hypothetical protein
LGSCPHWKHFFQLLFGAISKGTLRLFLQVPRFRLPTPTFRTASSSPLGQQADAGPEGAEAEIDLIRPRFRSRSVAVLPHTKLYKAF